MSVGKKVSTGITLSVNTIEMILDHTICQHQNGTSKNAMPQKKVLYKAVLALVVLRDDPAEENSVQPI